MNFIKVLSKLEGFSVILVVVDRLSKYAHFFPLQIPYIAVSVATVFIREVVRLHDIPESIVSDRDKMFLSHSWKELFRMQDPNLNRSTVYHLQMDGQIEVANENYVHCFVLDALKLWVK